MMRRRARKSDILLVRIKSQPSPTNSILLKSMTNRFEIHVSSPARQPNENFLVDPSPACYPERRGIKSHWKANSAGYAWLMLMLQCPSFPGATLPDSSLTGSEHWLFRRQCQTDMDICPCKDEESSSGDNACCLCT